jgi:carbonic anhydrase
MSAKVTVRYQQFNWEIESLLEKNKTFSKEYTSLPKEKKMEMNKGQRPKIAVLCCADSRVAPENIFKTHEIGEIFTVRIAGNIANKGTKESLLYATSAAGAKGVWVIGHESCGSVQAILKGHQKVMPGIAKHMHVHENEYSDLNDAVIAHVKGTVEEIRNDSRFKEIPVEGGYYSISTGEVHWIKI